MKKKKKKKKKEQKKTIVNYARNVRVLRHTMVRYYFVRLETLKFVVGTLI